MAAENVEKVELYDITKIFPYPTNVKQHNSNQVSRLATSIATYGFDQPIVVDENNVIIKGHGRYLASQKLELKKVPVVKQTNLTDQEKMASRIADNKVAESDYDNDMLFEELTELNKDGFTLDKLGFKTQTIKAMFSSKDLTDFGIESPLYNKDDEEDGGEPTVESNSEQDVYVDADPTHTQIESFMTSYKGDLKYLRHMPLIDYLNLHDKILVGVSGGKDSSAGFLWACENLPKDKVVGYFSDLGWGIDWTSAIISIKILEKMTGVKIICSGESNPKVHGGFYDSLLQFGYPYSFSCHVRNRIKLRNSKAVQLKYRDEKNPFGICVMLFVRWSESESRRNIYADRGILKDASMHFGNPLLRWTDTDVCKYLHERNFKLPTAYQHEERMGCLICPNETKKSTITVRKKYPDLWVQQFEWLARGARRNKGNLDTTMLKKMVAQVDDLNPHEREHFSSLYSPISLNPSEFENYAQEVLEEKFPCANFTRIRFNPEIHKFQNDMEQEFLRRASLMDNSKDCSNLFG